MNDNRKIYTVNLLHFLKYLLIFLFIIPSNQILNLRCKHLLISESNQISLKVKESGTISIIYSYIYKFSNNMQVNVL